MAEYPVPWRPLPSGISISARLMIIDNARPARHPARTVLVGDSRSAEHRWRTTHCHWNRSGTACAPHAARPRECRSRGFAVRPGRSDRSGRTSSVAGDTLRDFSTARWHAAFRGDSERDEASRPSGTVLRGIGAEPRIGAPNRPNRRHRPRPRQPGHATGARDCRHCHRPAIRQGSNWCACPVHRRDSARPASGLHARTPAKHCYGRRTAP